MLMTLRGGPPDPSGSSTATVGLVKTVLML